MANKIQGNKIFIDSTGEVTTQRIKVAYIIFNASTANDEIELGETAALGTTLMLEAGADKKSEIYDFSRSPIVFNNGLYVIAVSAGSNMTIITTSKGD